MIETIKKIFVYSYLEPFLSFSTKKIKYSFLFFILLSFLSSLLDISVIFYITNIIFSITKGTPIYEKIFNLNIVIDFSRINSYLIFVCLCSSAYFIKVYVNFFNYYIGAMFGSSLTKKFLRAFARVSYDYHLNQKESQFISSYSEDISNSVGVINACFSLISLCITFFIYIAYIFFTIPLSIFLILIIFSLVNYLVINKLIGKKIYSISKKISLNNPIRIKKIIDFYSLYKVIKVFGISDSLLNTVLEKDREHRFLNAKAPFLISLPSITIIHFFYLIGVSFFFFQSKMGFFDVYLNVIISLGLILQRTLPISNQLIGSINTIKLKSTFLLNIYKKYKTMLISSQKEVSQNRKINYSINKKRTKNFSLINFENVNFKYDKSNNYLYKNDLSFEVKSNTNYLITGPSGSGKSTLIDIILGLRIPTRGCLTYGNQFREISNSISYVPQEAVTIDDSFLKNLTLIDDNIIKNNEKNFSNILKCCLLDELILQSPDGINQKIGHGGIKLSGGQLQRLTIARALFRKASILLMDEPTASLDSKMSINLIKNILNFASSSSMTILVVSHDSEIFPLFANKIQL